MKYHAINRHYSLHNRLVVLCIVILLLIAGTYRHAYEVDVFPDLNAPTVVIGDRSQRYGSRRKWNSSPLPVKQP